jgi:3,4-dihydroxy-2-butanone 4-phosphate synthase
MPLSPIPEILDDLRAGRLIVLVDDENRENVGDFICAAEKITVELINFMTRIGGGYLCVPLTGEACDRLDLHSQSALNTSLRGTPLTVSIDGHPRHGVGTGISARDRVKTIQMLITPGSTPEDFVRPGHINPLRARDGGVLVRTGQTEGSLDLARLAGLHPSAVLIEIVKPDGEMARLADLEVICREHNLRLRHSAPADLRLAGSERRPSGPGPPRAASSDRRPRRWALRSRRQARLASNLGRHMGAHRGHRSRRPPRHRRRRRHCHPRRPLSPSRRRAFRRSGPPRRPGCRAFLP